MTTQPTPSADQPSARFHFKSRGLEVEFEGAPEFISAQIEHLRPALERELSRMAEETAPAAPAPAPAASRADASELSAPAGAPSLEEFYRRARSREGRGALQ